MGTTELPLSHSPRPVLDEVEAARRAFSGASLDREVSRAAALGSRPTWGYSHCAVAAALAAALLRRDGHLPPLVAGKGGVETRVVGTKFENRVLFPCIDDHEDALVGDVNEQLVADGLSLWVTSLRRTNEVRSSFDVYVEMMSAEGAHTVSINFKYGEKGGTDDVAGETSLLGEGMVGQRVRLEKAVAAQREGRLNGAGYLVVHLLAGETTLARAVSVFDVFAVEPEYFRWNRRNGLQAKASACAARMLELAEQRVPLEFSRSAERLTTWLLLSDIAKSLQRLEKTVALLPEGHPERVRLSGVLAAAAGAGVAPQPTPVQLDIFDELSEDTGAAPQGRSDVRHAGRGAPCGRRERDHRAIYRRRLQRFLDAGYRGEQDARRARRTGVGLRRRDPEAARVVERLGAANVIWAD